MKTSDKAKGKQRSVVTIFLVGAIAGIIFWGGFNTVAEMTNSLEFCTSCHEMGTVYTEYKETVHYKNTSGVRAICSDCHVPKPWGHKMVRKIKASKELYHKMVGTIDTPEKFEAHRQTMAERVWAEMKATDSRECRNCHTFDSMELALQDRYARSRHERAQEAGMTCIECHQGIAHNLPGEVGHHGGAMPEPLAHANLSE